MVVVTCRAKVRRYCSSKKTKHAGLDKLAVANIIFHSIALPKIFYRLSYFGLSLNHRICEHGKRGA